MIDFAIDVTQLMFLFLSVLLSGSALYLALKFMKKPKSYDRTTIIALISAFVPTLLVQGSTTTSIGLNILISLGLIKYGLDLDWKDAITAAVLYGLIFIIIVSIISIFSAEVTITNARIISFG